MDELENREALAAILTSCQDAHVKLDRILDSSKTMAKRKKTKLTADFWRRDAEQRANADRRLAILRKERQSKQTAG